MLKEKLSVNLTHIYGETSPLRNKEYHLPEKFLLWPLTFEAWLGGSMTSGPFLSRCEEHAKQSNMQKRNMQKVRLDASDYIFNPQHRNIKWWFHCNQHHDTQVWALHSTFSTYFSFHEWSSFQVPLLIQVEYKTHFRNSIIFTNKYNIKGIQEYLQSKTNFTEPGWNHE